eukprot:5621099-Amphidinium_carterae.1
MKKVRLLIDEAKKQGSAQGTLDTTICSQEPPSFCYAMMSLDGVPVVLLENSKAHRVMMSRRRKPRLAKDLQVHVAHQD